MSFTFTILYKTEKKVFKSISPSTILQQLVTESLEYFRLPANTSYQLKFRRSVLDLSQPVRFSNLPNNAQLDLVVSSSSGSGSCRVAISVMGRTDADRAALTDTFPDSLSLAAMLQRFVDDGKLPVNLFELSPEVVLLRSSFTRDSLTQTTLASLGLSGQSVRFQLRYSETGEVSGNSEKPATITSSSLALSTEAEKAQPKQTLAAITPSIIPTTNTRPPSPPPTEPQLSPPSVRGVEEVRGAVEFKVAEEEVVEKGVVEESTLQSESETLNQSTVSVTEAVEGILRQNFDVVSRAAVIALVKYLLNILLHPHPTIDSKYHVIKLDNKVLKEKILPAQGALSVLTAVGFIEKKEKGVLQIVPDADNLKRVEEGVRQLQRAMDDLNIPEDDRSAIPPLPIVTSSPPPVIDFDPFKTIVIRPQGLPGPISAAASQPSNTEVQVEQLKRKRAELEGNPSEILRNTQVFLPRTADDVSVLSDSKDKQEDSTDFSNDSGVSRAMMQKFLKREREEEEGKPLTTSALRELQKLTNEKVYSETVVRVRFPDKVEVVAHFHPRHTLKEVYLWLLEQLSPHLLVEVGEGEGCEEVERRKVLQAMDLFELFISPPRTSLLPAKIKTTTTAHRSTKIFVQWNESDLLSLGLVPAALLSLTWQKPLPQGQGQAPPGFYLKEDLLTSAIAWSLSQVSLPQGRSLTTTTNNNTTSNSMTSGEAQDKGKSRMTSQSDSKKPTSSSGKPKWFKL